jgi:hypothetical protein
MGNLVRLDLEVNGAHGDDIVWPKGTILRNPSTGEAMTVVRVEWGERPKATAWVRRGLEREGWDVPADAA